MDTVILGQDCYLEDGVGTYRPNNNQMIVGSSGSGKSMSTMLPTILKMEESSMIGTFPKRGEAWAISRYQKSKGYRTLIVDLTKPEKSPDSFDPLHYVESQLDVDDLARSIVLANPNSNNPKDTYWNDSATALMKSLIMTSLMIQDNACMTDVLDLFDNLKIDESGKGITTSLDGLYSKLRDKVGDCEAVTCFMDFCQLPYSTAGCVRDTLAKAIRRLFPQPIRDLMRKKEHVNFHRLAREKTSLMIITSPVNPSLYLFANLLFGVAIKQLLEYAERFREQRLPRQVRLMFDDFACGATINDFSRHISIFRAAGLSAMMLIQSESQLRSLYSEDEATTIINNCSSYVYFPGGMDLTTCRNISQRLDAPLVDILYAPVGNVIVMCSGQKPRIVPRYDTLNSEEYRRYMEVARGDGGGER